jgi:hypothetical protein
MSVNDYDEELNLAIEDLVDARELEVGTPAYGVAQQVINSGYDSLSPKQRHVYNTEVLPLLERQGEKNETARIKNSNPD